MMMCKPAQYKLRTLLTLYAVLLYTFFISVPMTAQLAESKESVESFIDDNDIAQAKTEYDINNLQAIRNTENAKISRSIYSKLKSLFGTSSTTTTSVAPSVNCNHGVWNSSRNICVCESGWETSLDQDILNNNFEYCTKRASATSTVKPEDLFAQTDAGNKRLFIGLICGGVALIIILITLYCYCCRHRRQSRVRIESPHMQTPWQHFWNKCTGNQHHNNQLPLPLPLYTGNQLPLPVQDPYMIGANNYQIEYLQGGNNNNNNRYTRPQITFDRYYNPNSQTQLNTTDMSMTGTQLNEKYISQPYTSSTPLPDTEEKIVNSSYNMYNSELSGQMMQYNDAPSPEPVPPTSTSMLSSAYNNNNNTIPCYQSSLSQMANYNSSTIPVTQYYSAPPVNNTPALQSYETSNCQAARQHSQVREPFYEDYNNNNNNDNNCDDKSMQMCMTRQANGNEYTHNAAQLLPQYQVNPSSHRKSRNHSVQPSPIPTSHEPFAECTEPISQMYEQQTQLPRLPQVQPELSLQYQQQQEQQQEQVQHTKEHRKESRQRHHRHRSNSASHHRNKKSNDNSNNVISAFIDPNACAREVYNNAENGNHDNTAQDQNMIANNNVGNNNKNCTGEKYQNVIYTNSRISPSNKQNRVLESTLPEQYDQSYVYGEANAEQNKVLQKVRRHKHASVNNANAQN